MDGSIEWLLLAVEDGGQRSDVTVSQSVRKIDGSEDIWVVYYYYIIKVGD